MVESSSQIVWAETENPFFIMVILDNFSTLNIFGAKTIFKKNITCNMSFCNVKLVTQIERKKLRVTGFLTLIWKKVVIALFSSRRTFSDKVIILNR